MLKRRRTEQ